MHLPNPASWPCWTRSRPEKIEVDFTAKASFSCGLPASSLTSQALQGGFLTAVPETIGQSRSPMKESATTQWSNGHKKTLHYGDEDERQLMLSLFFKNPSAIITMMMKQSVASCTTESIKHFITKKSKRVWQNVHSLPLRSLTYNTLLTMANIF